MKLAVLLAGIAAAVAAAAPAGARHAAPGDLSGFSGDLPAGTHLVARPIYREHTASTSFRLRAVPCAAGAARGATCFVAR